MKITPAFVQSEFIGLNAKVVKSTNLSCVGIKGKVTNETRNTVSIQQAGKDKTITKNTSTFQLTTHDGTIVEVDGKIIIGRPEDRVKKQLRRRW